MTTEHDRLTMVERDSRDHAKSISELTSARIEDKKQLADLERKEAVRTVEEKHLDERLDRIESRLDGVYRLGWWILGAFGASAVALIANFAFRGGFVVGG